MSGAAPEPVEHPARVLVYIGCIWGLALLLSLASWMLYGPPADPVALLILAAMGIASNAVSIPDVGARVSLSFLSVIVLACVILIGPVGTVVVASVAMALARVDVPRRARVFNTGMAALVAVVGALAYQLAGGTNQLAFVTSDQLWSKVGAPLVVADVVQCLTNAAVLAGIMRVNVGTPFRRFAGQMLNTSGRAYVGYGIIGFLFAILWEVAGVGPVSALLIIAPLYVARWAFQQFGEEQRAHERTLGALVASVEARDPLAIGHSERIARLASWMAESLSLSPVQANDLHYAALLHDIGRVGVPPQTGPHGPDDAIDFAAVRRHPHHGVDLVSGISFLSGTLDGIRHHHERYDGRGYPYGLSGVGIPLYARVIAVADAFDSLTTPRAYRPALSPPEALAVIRGRAGTHFDPGAVDALEAALERHQWAGTHLPSDAVAAASTYFDHDDPDASDVIAEEQDRRRPWAGIA